SQQQMQRPSTETVDSSIVPPPPPLATAPRPSYTARPSVTFDAAQPVVFSSLVEGRRPTTTSVDDTARRSPAGSFDSVNGGGPRVPGRPGRPRRSSVDREDNPALRALFTGTGR